MIKGMLLLSDIQLSPLLWHFLLLLLSCIKAAVLKFLRCANSSAGWDAAVMLLIFCNPFLAFFADSFWNIWLQSLLLGLPLYFFAFYLRDEVFGFAQYSDGTAAVMFSICLFFYGHVLSCVFLLIRYIWQGL